MQLQFYTQESIGTTRKLTPEGYLLCENVPLARVGTLLYAKGEIPVDAGPNGIISIERTEDEVFHPNAIASFAGKPLTNDHPSESVDPTNWRLHSMGVVMHPRRGDGRQFDSDFLYADLLVQDHDAIRDILAGKIEVSAGYDATYEQIAPGYGKQSNIIGNHVAFVERGRCGPRCAIGDKAMPTKNKFAAFRDRIMKAHKTGDEEAVTREVNGMIGEMISGTNDELNPAQTNEWEGSPHEKTGEKQIVINVHGQPHQGNMPLSTAAPPAAATAGSDGTAAADPAQAAAAGGGDPTAQIMQRLQVIEQTLATMMQGNGDNDDDDAPTGDAAISNPEGRPANVPFEGQDPETVTEGGTGKGEPTNTGEDPGPAPSNAPTGDAARVITQDSRSLRTGFDKMVAEAAILCPDYRVPTFDAAAGRASTIDGMCKFRKGVLVEAYKNAEIKQHIDDLLDNPPDFKTMTCDAAATLFIGASRAVRDANNARITNPRPVATKTFSGHSPTPAEINKRNRERFPVNR